MNLISQHKALIITSLIAAIIVLLLFNLHLSNNIASIAETYYELEPEKIIEDEKIEEKLLETHNASLTKQTNLAYNEAKKLEELDEEYLNKIQEHYEKHAKSTLENEVSPEDVNNVETTENISTFNKINDLLAAKSKNKKSNDEVSSEEINIQTGSNRNSTMSYSLVGRTHKFLPTPIYLCEKSGIIVINITVNHLGRVIQTSLNGSSTSKNECLIDHATEYAENARFSADASKKTQIGTITFSFKGKN